MTNDQAVATLNDLRQHCIAGAGRILPTAKAGQYVVVLDAVIQLLEQTGSAT